MSGTRIILFDRIAYIKPDPTLKLFSHKVWPFIDSADIREAFKYMIENNRPLSYIASKKETQYYSYKLMYKPVACYWIGVSINPPPTYDKYNELSVANYEPLYFAKESQRDLSLLMLIGMWGYVWWLTYGDLFHVTKQVVLSFPGTFNLSNSNNLKDMQRLLSLSKDIQAQMLNHLEFQTNAGQKVGRYNTVPLRHLTDEADFLLAKLWGVSEYYEAIKNLRDRFVFDNKSSKE